MIKLHGAKDRIHWGVGWSSFYQDLNWSKMMVLDCVYMCVESSVGKVRNRILVTSSHTVRGIMLGVDL